MINSQHAISPSFQAHSALETQPASRLMLRYTRLLVAFPPRYHVSLKSFARTSFLLLCYHPSVWRVRPGVRPRGSTGYADSNMDLSEAVILAVVPFRFSGVALWTPDLGGI